MIEAASKLLVFTDLHLVSEGDDIIGLDPAARFREGLEHALAQHPDAVRLVIMGDLAHHGRTAQYKRLNALMANVAMPVTYMMGNHDNRDVFRKVFPEAEATTGGYLQQMVDLGDTCLIALDTNERKPVPQHSGRLCAERLAWLEHALAWANGRQVVVAMHHPPLKTGFVGMDGIALQDPAPFRDMLKAYPGEVHLLCGHVHRTVSGRAHGLSFTLFKSPCHQQPMTLALDGTEHSVDEPGAYGIVLCGPDGIIVHSEDFATAAAATPLRDGYSV